MDRYLGQIWAIPSLGKPDGKKLKKKLQKSGGPPTQGAPQGAPQRPQRPSQRPFSVNYSDTKASAGHKPQRSSMYFSLFSSNKSSAVSQPPLPTPADSEHAKWLQEFRKSGYMCRDARQSRNMDSEQTWERPSSVVPEFAHLAIGSGEPTAPRETTRSLPTNNEIRQTKRRYAKTPVSHIGQLEARHSLRIQDTSENIPNTESIAESYTALLESRNPYSGEATISRSTITAKPSESFVSQTPSLMPSPLGPATPLSELPPTRESPRSDDGTLVASEEDPIDFKHGPASSVPSSPSWTNDVASAEPEHERAAPTHRSDMELCLGLLTKELLSTFNGSPNQSTSALQINLMIEAYEKLRDQILTTGDGPLKPIFDTWLKALRSVHEGMTGDDGQESESDYGD
ncbi:hypothetical protein F4861DRAFT_398575 [Xylaria intraflava]|nr:hypothetical protein F4861DRAFT_398575 [Xylaria intraflava]